MKLNRTWVAAGFMGAAHLLQQCKQNTAELVQIRTAMVYLKSVEIVRDLFLYQTGVLVCVIFSIFGVVLIQTAAIFYIPLGTGRIAAALGVGAFDSLIALACLGYLVSSKHWLKKAARYNSCIKELEENGRDTLTRNMKSVEEKLGRPLKTHSH